MDDEDVQRKQWIFLKSGETISRACRNIMERKYDTNYLRMKRSRGMA